MKKFPKTLRWLLPLLLLAGIGAYLALGRGPRLDTARPTRGPAVEAV